MSSKSPFRSPAPPPRDQSEAVIAPPPSSPPPLFPSPISGPSNSQSDMPTSSSNGSFPVASHRSVIPEDDPDDLPPPYTPAPNQAVGEETVGLGPRRPFQQPPPIPSSSQDSRLYPGWTPTQAPASAYHPPPQHPSAALAPWQTQQQYRQRQNGGGGLFGMLFDTVRDIADAVSGGHDDRMTANAGAYASPFGNTGNVYAPPPGPPGQMTQPLPPPPGPPPPRSASTPPRSPRPMVPDDGTPTRTPVPGHPLLRDGNLLVYPRDHLCTKCKNTGYKNYDPSHPCRKCWEKYGRTYTGALTYTPWAPSGNDPRMQRPLPKFVPPHLSSAGSISRSQYGSSPSQIQHTRSVSQPHYPQSSGSGPSYYVRDPLSSYNSPPPVPHAIPVSPGDPRLGGSLCWRCGGAGIHTVMLIDVMTCDTCGGTGRVWT